jgi:hypothetical protein
MLIIILLMNSNRERKRRRFHHNHRHKTRHLSSAPVTGAHTYTNNVMYRTNNPKLSVEGENKQRLLPIKSESSIRPVSYPVYSTTSTHELPPLVLPVPSPPPPNIPLSTPQPLSVRRLYKSYV